MLVSALLMTISIAWALYDEAFGQRPWKGMQQEFVTRYTRYLDSIQEKAGKSETDIKESPEYQKLADDEKAARDAIQTEFNELDAQVKLIQNKLNAVTDPFQNQRGRLTVINYNIETSEGRAKDRYRRDADAKMKEVVAVEMPSDNGSNETQVVRMDYVTLEKTYNDLREAKSLKLARKAELLKPAQELDKKRDDYLKNQLIGWSPNQIEGEKRSLGAFKYSI